MLLDFTINQYFDIIVYIILYISIFSIILSVSRWFTVWMVGN